VLDMGLTGQDWVLENNSDVVEISELVYSKQKLVPVRWVLAVPDESRIKKPEDLDGGIVATELVNVTRKYFADKGMNVKVEFSWGATEIKARLLDGIVDVTETGSSIKANNLRIIDTILTSNTCLIANKNAIKIDWKREKIENIAMLLRGAIEARGKVGLKMNVPKAQLEAVTRILPSEKSPTVSALADQQLKRAGATGIITYPLNKVIP
jgi:ATP phosphoribosyltransferase